MDLSLVTAALGAQTGLTQLALAGSMLKMNTQNAGSVVKLIDAAAEYEFSRQRRSRRRNEPRYHSVA
jgi:hypothetical protein